jgi:hypothetical protein
MIRKVKEQDLSKVMELIAFGLGEITIYRRSG